MAINVDLVYKTVLLILNKEQRGYVTPEEFNKIGTQVQLEIFETYFDDLNQQLRIPSNESEYADRQKNIDDKISIFKTTGDCIRTSPNLWFTPPTNMHRLGTVIHNGITELQRAQKNDLLYINKSALTKPTTTYPIYTYERGGGTLATSGTPNIYVYPSSITTGITASYIRKPADVKWGYKGLNGGAWVTGPYIYDESNSIQFELDNTEQHILITKILLYMGIIIQDEQIIQVAAQQAQAETINSKT